MVQCASVKINILNRLYILCALTSASLAKCNEVPTSFFWFLFVRSFVCSFVRLVVRSFVLFPSASSFSEEWHKIIYVKFSINKICFAALQTWCKPLQRRRTNRTCTAQDESKKKKKMKKKRKKRHNTLLRVHWNKASWQCFSLT